MWRRQELPASELTRAPGATRARRGEPPEIRGLRASRAMDAGV
jgi:hypothetical protein